MTVQEIQEVGFEKAVFGGYDMQSVDSFLEQVAESFSAMQSENVAMQKENAALKAKMKVLVDKIEEYRGVEDGMRRTLMTAQTIAQDTINKAKEEAEQIVSVARSETEGKVKSTQEEIALEEQKLEVARKNTVEFIARISKAYQAQAQALIELAKEEKLVRAQIQQSAADQPAQQAVSASVQQPQAAAADEPAQESADGPVEDATRKFNFGELKFGADYDPKDAK